MENVTTVIPIHLLDDLIDSCKEEQNPTRKIFAKYAVLPVKDEDYVSIEIDVD